MIQQSNQGFLQFTEKPLTQRFSDLFSAKVGAVPKSKKDSLLDVGDELFVHSGTVKDHSLVYYDLYSEWIRPWNGDKAQIFVNCKTREKFPFFCRDTPFAWDGSVIALFPTDKAKSEFCCDKDIVDYLNSLDWFELGCEDATGRKHFSVGVFERLMLP